jgi:predicted LPLAT superfamily acyltransferase
MSATPAEGGWLGARERGSSALLAFMIWVTRKLGRAVGRALLPPIVLYFTVFSGRSRAASRAFLGRALGRRATLGDVYRHYHAFAATLLDRVYLLSGRWDYFDVRLHGDAELRAIVARGKGCVLLGSHLGSFEALRAAAVFSAHWPLAMLMDNANAQKAARAFAALNPDLAGMIIEAGTPDSLIRAKERLDAGALLGVLGDRLRPGDKAVPCPFLGGTMRFPEAPYVIAAVLGAPVVLCFGLYRGGRRYDLHFEVFRDPLELPRGARAEAVAALAREYAARLEHYARSAPYNWFNFYDVWAPPGEPGARSA